MKNLVEILTPNFKFGDERGMLVQLVRDGYKQINVVSSKEGYTRGGHYHKLNREAFYVVCGELELTVHLDDEEKIYRFSAGDMFEIPPMVTHYFKYLEDTVLVALYDKGVELENGDKDIYAN